MRLLLHACCGPCVTAIQPLLAGAGARVTGFWYNPNIHSYAEYQRRLMAAGYLFGRLSLPLEIAAPDFPAFLDGLSGARRAGERCRFCWTERLGRTAHFARENGFDAFTTSLLASPHQDRRQLEMIGAEAGRRAGIRFIAPDCGDRYREARRENRRLGLYHQNYCGCLFSEWERFAPPAGGGEGG